MTRAWRGVTVAAVTSAYFFFVFRIGSAEPWHSGLSDWVDPYFINGLLESWLYSLRHFTNPASPPMFYPATGTLGYSHGLILFAPFYIVFRLVFHPFTAHTLTILAVMELGALCLYLLLRRLGASFIEALVLTMFFCTSKNIINGSMAIWSQRASVFLIPPILLLACSRRWLALSGFLAALLFVQDFYTAQFALLFAAAAAAPWLMKYVRVSLVVALAAGGWAFYVFRSGGGHVTLFGMRLTYHDWIRPAIVSGVALTVYGWRARRQLADGMRRLVNPFTFGFATGAVIFAAIYLPTYSQHSEFPEEHLLNALVRPSFHVYETMRCFVAAAIVAAIAWLPAARLTRSDRMRTVWFFAVSLLIIPLAINFNGFSLWELLFAHLPGFSAIRDPRRIIYLYELALVIGVAALAARMPAESSPRRAIAVAVVAIVVTTWNGYTATYARPIATFQQWVRAPIAIDPACRSFYIKPASARYMDRSPNKSALYNVDALFIALDSGIPTLNGYSAWAPPEWRLHNPHESVYGSEQGVSDWIRRNNLTNVCELDIEARTMAIRPR